MFSSKMSIVVESKLESVPLAGTLIRTFCVESGVSPLESGQIEVCVVEAANNSIVHAYRYEPGHAVEVIAKDNGGEFLFEVWDQGLSMDPGILAHNRRHLLDQLPDANAALPESGRGLAIIQTIMDGIEYATFAGKNHLSMRKHIERVRS